MTLYINLNCGPAEQEQVSTDSESFELLFSYLFCHFIQEALLSFL